MKNRKGICLKCKQPILIVTDSNQVFCGICAKDMEDRIKAARNNVGKDTRGKVLKETRPV